MDKCLRYCFLVLLLHLSFVGFAQKDEVADTVNSILQTTPESERDTPVFLPIQQQTPVDVRDVSPQKIDQLKKDDDYWYANLEPEKKQLKPVATKKGKGNQEDEDDTSLMDRPWFSNLLWIIILCSFIAVVIWY